MTSSSKDFFVRDRSEFLRLRDDLSELVNIDAPLLDQVFVGTWSGFYAVDYFQFGKIEFGKLLKEVSITYGDDELFSYLQDDVSNLWFEGLNALRWPKDWQPEDYLAALYFDHPYADTTWNLLEGHTTSFLFGDSRKWVAMPCYNFELVFFAFRDDRIKSAGITRNELWLTKDSAIDCILFNYFVKAGDQTRQLQRDKVVQFFRHNMRDPRQ